MSGVIIPADPTRVDPDIERATLEAYEKSVVSLVLGTGAQMRFFAALVMRMRYSVVTWIPTAATDGRQIYLNPQFWLDLTPAQRRTVLAHEVMHCVEKHTERRQHRDPYIFNIACFPAGTLLPGNVLIESVASMVSHLDGELIEVAHQGGKISATPEHPFFVRKRKNKVGLTPVRLLAPEWVKAENIRIGDYVCVPRLERYGLRDDAVINLHSYIRNGISSRANGNRAVKSIPLNQDTAWLIGLYVAEGSASPSVSFSLGSHETHLADRIKAIVSSIGYSASVSVNGSSMAVNLGTTVLGRWLKANVGTVAKNKHIPDVILRHSDPLIRQAFLKGVVDGDGCTQVRNGKTWIVVGVCSPSLIRDIILLLAQDGLGARVSTQTLKPRWIGKMYTTVRTVIHNVTWNPDGPSRSMRELNGNVVVSTNARYRTDEHGVWYPVKSTEHYPYSGNVYNLTNTPDHTYVAESVLVHNCDLEINYILEEAKMEFPKDACLPGKGAFVGTAGNQISETYYELLLEQQHKKTGFFGQKGKGKGKGKGSQDPGGPNTDPGGCGVIFDNSPGEAERTKLSLDWDVAIKQAAQVAKDTQERSRGTMPGYFSKLLEKLLKPPKIPWYSELRQFFTVTARDDYSWASPNRRHVASGVYLPSLRSQRLGEICMFVDLSGSMMGGDDLARCATEMTAILENYPSKVWIVYHDTHVRTVQEWTPLDGPIEFKGDGGGGTDHVPCFTWMVEQGIDPCVSIFFTDLQTRFPVDPPSHPVFWVTVSGGSAPFGRVLEI